MIMYIFTFSNFVYNLYISTTFLSVDRNFSDLYNLSLYLDGLSLLTNCFAHSLATFRTSTLYASYHFLRLL